jgi:hypothetical protein
MALPARDNLPVRWGWSCADPVPRVPGHSPEPLRVPRHAAPGRFRNADGSSYCQMAAVLVRRLRLLSVVISLSQDRQDLRDTRRVAGDQVNWAAEHHRLHRRGPAVRWPHAVLDDGVPRRRVAQFAARAFEAAAHPRSGGHRLPNRLGIGGGARGADRAPCRSWLCFPWWLPPRAAWCCTQASDELVVPVRDSPVVRPPIHPQPLRCSSVTWLNYASSSCLAAGAAGASSSRWRR